MKLDLISFTSLSLFWTIEIYSLNLNLLFVVIGLDWYKFYLFLSVPEQLIINAMMNAFFHLTLLLFFFQFYFGVKFIQW